jgi:hypothetical protein
VQSNSVLLFQAGEPEYEMKLANTWKTVRQDCGKVSKWDLESDPSANFPPKICIPSSENIKMNRNSITNRELMEEIELTRDLTKFPIDDQYLKRRGQRVHFNNSSYQK